MSLERDIDAAKKLLLRHGYIVPDAPAHEEELRVHYWRIELTMAIGRFLGENNPGGWDLRTNYFWEMDLFRCRIRRVIRGLDGVWREKRGGIFNVGSPFSPQLPDVEMLGKRLAWMLVNEPLAGGLPVIAEGAYYLQLFQIFYENGETRLEFPPGSVDITIEGNVLGDEEFVRERLVPLVRSALQDSEDFGLVIDASRA